MNINQKLYFFLFLVTFASCDLINPEEEIPSYIQIDDIIVNSNIRTEGSASNKITEAWVFANEEFIGAYDLPATVPVLASGNQEIYIKAGIKDNGINTVPEIYPFYTTDTFQVDLTTTEITKVSPQLGYLPNTKFEFIEDFERSDHIFSEDRDGDIETKIVASSQDPFEGSRSGKIVLTTDHPIAEVGTDLDRLFSGLQDKGVFVYLEVNYKSEVPVVWGAIGYPDGVFSSEIPIYDPGFNSSSEWKKIYFNFSRILFENEYPQYQFSLIATLPIENGEFTQDRAEIYLDNIKLVHF